MASLPLVMNQINRLKSRFGEKAFDDEFVKLATKELMNMVDTNVIRSVDVWIGSRAHNRPPLLTDFREARIAENKAKFENDLRGATNFLERRAPGEMRANLRTVLSKEFGQVDSIGEALEIARLRFQTSPEEPA